MSNHFQEKPSKMEIVTDIIDELNIPEEEHDAMHNELHRMKLQQLGWLHHYILELKRKE